MSRSSRKIKLSQAINDIYRSGGDPIATRARRRDLRPLKDGSIPLCIQTTAEELTAALEAQNCCCKKCGRDLNLHWSGINTAQADHNRLLGYFRGWLCMICNWDAGYEDRVERANPYYGHVSI